MVAGIETAGRGSAVGNSPSMLGADEATCACKRKATGAKGFERHAASLWSDLRLQAQGSPIRLTKGKSP